VGYMVTWPHLRPGCFTCPQPSFRALIDAPRAAEVLGEALAADARRHAAGCTATDGAKETISCATQRSTELCHAAH
jgi:hypothetical protein